VVYQFAIANKEALQMRTLQIGLATVTLEMLLASGVVAAADEPTVAAAESAKPTFPAISDLLTSSGITATGYVSGTFSYQTYSASGATAPKDASGFVLQQAAFTLARQPTSGFGALVNVLAGQNIYTPNYGYAGASKTSTQFQLVQGYLQYVNGRVTIIGGKFLTLAGAEVIGSVGNTNITRSLLFSYEPITHTGIRVTYAASDQLNLIIGANNGWVYSDELSAGSGKTVEAGVAWTPSKAFSWTAQGYFGRDTNFAGVTANHTLLDTVLTWNATSALSLIASVDWGKVDSAFGPNTGSADWTGYAAYANYALNDQWRVSLRGEYFDDNDGYLTAIGPGVGQKLKEGTVDLGYSPIKNFELRLEGRYDAYDTNSLKVAQGWVEGIYKF
jgi:hypothetical protein